MKVNCSAYDSNLFFAQFTESVSYATCMPFLHCSAVQNEGLACGRGADSNAGLSDHSTRTISINL